MGSSAMRTPAPSRAEKRGVVPMPSIWPRTAICQPAGSRRKTENFRLEEPALRTSRVESTPPLRRPKLPAAIVREEHGDGTTRDARSHAVGPARQDDRHPCAEDEARTVGVGEERELLGEHVARLEIRDEEDVGIAGNLRGDAFDPGRV